MTIKQKIFEKLEKDGYCTDSDLAKIYGKEPNYYTAEQYKKAWLKLKFDRERFGDEEIIKKSHHNRGYYIQLKGMDKYAFYKVSKDFYNEV